MSGESSRSGGRRALIVEGGGMRTIYAAGVLDAFAEAGADDFDLYIGVSAGAICLASHLADQPGRDLVVMTDGGVHKSFKGMMHYLAGGDLIDLDQLWEESQRVEPLAVNRMVARLENEEKEFFAVANDVHTGEVVLLRPDENNIRDVLRATSALPMLVRKQIEIDGRTLIDGGVLASIPINQAIDLGADDVVVIRTQHPDYIKKGIMEKWMANWFFKHLPVLRRCLLDRARLYNEQVGLVMDPPEGLRIRQIQPDRPLYGSRTCTDVTRLLADYARGLADGRAFLRPDISQANGMEKALA